MIPKPQEIIREAIIVMAGAALAAFLVGRFPQFKGWIKEQWSA